MRRLLAIVTLVAVGASAPAWADVTLRYKPVLPASATAEARAALPTLTLDADDAGQARIEMAAPGGPSADQAGDRAPSVALITREGVGYFALSGPTPGQEIVARQEDALALVAPIARGLASGSAREGMNELMGQRVEIVPVGAETVAGVRGNLYRIVMISGETRGPPIEIVLSSDPRLAPAGRELVRLAESLRPLLVVVAGGEPQVYVAVRALLGLGTPLRIANQFALDSFSTDDVPDSRFALPGPALSREQLGLMLGAMMGSRRPPAPGAAADESDATSQPEAGPRVPTPAPAPPAGAPPNPR